MQEQGSGKNETHIGRNESRPAAEEYPPFPPAVEDFGVPYTGGFAPDRRKDLRRSATGAVHPLQDDRLQYAEAHGGGRPHPRTYHRRQ